MATKKVSELAALTSPDGAEELLINDGGTSKKITITNATASKLPLAGGTMTGNIVMSDDTSIGIGDSAERIEFDGAGDISLLGCSVGIGTTSPSARLHVDDNAEYWGTGGRPSIGIQGQRPSIAFYDDTETVSNVKGILYDDNSLQFSHGLYSDDAADWAYDEKVIDMVIADTGDVTVSTGNLVIGTAGKGIDFSATTDGGVSTPSELLDDYEEGTWTPAMTATSGSYAVNDSSTEAVYTKVGNLVHWTCRIVLSSVSTPSGVLNITGLPFTSHNVPGGDMNTCQAGQFLENTVGDIASDIIGLVPDNGTTCNIRTGGTTGAGNALAAQIDAGTFLLLSGTYFAA